MIQTITHKGLKLFFEEEDPRKINPDHKKKIRRILGRLHAAKELKDMNYPGSNLHLLKKPPHRGLHSVNVNGNYRIVFKFEKGDAYNVDYLDTH